MWTAPGARNAASEDLVQPVPAKVKLIAMIIAEMKVFILKKFTG